MALRVRRLPRATADLDDLWYYIATEGNGPKVADAVLEKIDTALRHLGLNPQIGRLRDEFGTNIRSLPVGSFMLFYRESDVEVLIIRVLSAAQDVDEQTFGD